MKGSSWIPCMKKNWLAFFNEKFAIFSNEIENFKTSSDLTQKKTLSVSHWEKGKVEYPCTSFVATQRNEKERLGMSSQINSTPRVNFV